MSFKIFAGSTSLAALAMASVACSSSDNAPAGPSNLDGGGGAATGGSSSGGASAKGGTSGKGGSGGGGGASDASTEGSTSCGDVPVLGDFWSSVPAECTSCMASKCCSELGACGSDTTCSTYRKCLDACSQSDGTCQSACLPDSGTPAGSNAITTCRVDNCDACANLSCLGTAWPAPATAHDISMHATLTNFSTGKPVAGITVKVCGHTDMTCKTPLDSKVTASDGTVDVKLPAGPGGTDAYILQSGPGILTELSYLHFLGGDTAYSNIILQVLDSKTASLFQTLAGGTPFPDGGTPDGSLPDGGTAQGALSVLPRSCQGSVIGGATITSSNAGAAAVTSYLVKGIPSTTAKATDSTGIGAIVNHAVGTTTVTVKLGTKTLGTTDVIVRPGFLTTVTVPPN